MIKISKGYILPLLLIISVILNIYLIKNHKNDVNIKVQNVVEKYPSSKNKGLSLNIKGRPFNARGNNISDDTNSFQSAIKYISKQGGGTIYLPNGIYKITRTIYIPGDISIVGSGQGEHASVIRYTGKGYAIKSSGSHKRINIENIRIDLNGKNDGIHLGEIGSNLGNNVFPAHLELRNVTVGGVGKGKIGIRLSNVSHVNLVDVSSGYGKTTGGHGLFVYADKLNSGVIHAENSTFGRVNASDVGMEIDGTVDLDTFSFEGCYFGGRLPIRLGKNTYVRNVNFISSHIEGHNKEGMTNLVEIDNAFAVNFIGTSLIGFKQNDTRGFVFRGKADKVNIIGTEANGIMGAIYADEGGNLGKSNIIQDAALTNGSTAKQFLGFK